MKKYIALLLSGLLLLMTGCGTKAFQLISVPKMQVDNLVVVKDAATQQAGVQDNLDDTISRYLEEKVAYKSIDGVTFEAHELYGTEEKNGKIYAYIWSRQQEYGYKNDTLVSGAGSSMPLVMILARNANQHYTVVEFQAPQDGEQYGASIRNLFPAAYQEKILTRTNADGLEEIVRQKAVNYFFVKQNGETGSSPVEEQLVKTGEYLLYVPAKWVVEHPSGNGLSFRKDSKPVGGLDVLMHYSNQPITTLFPNHTEVVEQEELQGFAANGIKVRLNATQPSASGDTSVVKQLHYYFLIGEFAYDLYFDLGQVDEQTILQIARSFQPTNSADSSTQKDGELKTAEGTYTGQIDGNSIEIKLSGISGDTAFKAFRFSEETKAQFSQLELKTGDAVKISYTRNGYDQLVLMRIEKV